MDLKEMTYIVTIADEGSISKAAEKLYMAQSSLSQFLLQYEAELGTTLFMRTARGVRPTASGSVFLSHARQILQEYHRAKCELWDIEELKGGQINLGISTFRGTYLLPSVLKRFHERYPNIHVEITEKDSMPLEDMLLEGLLDIALIALPSTRLKKQIDFLTRDEIYIVAAKDHPVFRYVHRKENGRLWVSLTDAAKFEFILGPPRTILGNIARTEFERLHIEPIARNTNITAPFAAAMARAGIGLAFTYQSCIVPDPNVEYLCVGKDGMSLDLNLAYPVGGYRSKAAMALAKLFHEIYP